MNRPTLVVLSLLAGCSSAPASGPAKKISPMSDPVADAAARAAVARPMQVLAKKIDLFLPPGLYSDFEYRPYAHDAREYETELGRRISIRPPGDPKDVLQPARVTIGGWKLASFGPIEVLFGVDRSGAPARLRASGVDLFVRDGRTERGIATVTVDGERVDARGAP
ncbi:MAG TPA: hypothetical protein VKE69_12170 [Planctomycetota bacterium]|nr:hypothetical protein [Planctomycetota bacterium]